MTQKVTEKPVGTQTHMIVGSTAESVIVHDIFYGSMHEQWARERMADIRKGYKFPGTYYLVEVKQIIEVEEV